MLFYLSQIKSMQEVVILHLSFSNYFKVKFIKHSLLASRRCLSILTSYSFWLSRSIIQLLSCKITQKSNSTIYIYDLNLSLYPNFDKDVINLFIKAKLDDSALLPIVRTLKVIFYNRPKDCMLFFPIIPSLRERVFKPEKYERQELEGNI
jgi:hypothetical protein